MDDPRTQNTLDALADLFLTQAAREKTVASRTQDALHGVAEQPASPRPGLTVPGLGDDDPLEGPAPIRLAPKAVATTAPLPRHRAQPAAASSHTLPPLHEPKLRYTGHEHDMAENRPAIGGESTISATSSVFDDESIPPQPAPAQAAVEAVILGNLPGIAGPWLTQYAQALAEQTGPVLILHIESPRSGDGGQPGQIEVELVEPIQQRDAAAAPLAARIPPIRVGGTEPLIQLIDGLVRARTGRVANILIHLEADTDPSQLHRLAAVSDWTLLAGCDEFAVAGVQSLLAQLIEAEPGLAEKQVALMMMGGDEAQARAAAQRVAVEVDPLLDTPIHWLGSQQKMSPVNVRQLGVYNDLGTLWPPLMSYVQKLVRPAAKPVRQAPAPPPLRSKPMVEAMGNSQEPKLQDPGTAAPGRVVAGTQGSQVRSQEPGARGLEPGVGLSVDKPPKVEIVPPPQASTPEAGTAARSAARPTTPFVEPANLARLVLANSPALAGGIALEARCPFQPDIELLLDQAGVLHLLRRDAPVGSSGNRHQDESAALRAAIVDLVEARRWVVEHHQLLQLTQRNARFAEIGMSGGAYGVNSGVNSGGEPVLHLLTDKPHLATGLVARLGNHIKLHLLQQIQIADHTAWYCTPLS